MAKNPSAKKETWVQSLGREDLLEKELNQEEAEIMNKPITSTEIEAVIKNLLPNQKLRNRWLHR